LVLSGGISSILISVFLKYSTYQETLLYYQLGIWSTSEIQSQKTFFVSWTFQRIYSNYPLAFFAAPSPLGDLLLSPTVVCGPKATMANNVLPYFQGPRTAAGVNHRQRQSKGLRTHLVVGWTRLKALQNGALASKNREK